ncbi:hypothetical protein LMG8526HA_00334 [Lactococcus lactis]|uniref:hypothetical protein n=1 Tax=Lactococcus lactis TaxID=1358 RepID=UPI000B0112AE|nr:hypothetical protein [Lactococcus lactis]MDU0399494.1 hypothetical protein [Lactococcus lactis]
MNKKSSALLTMGTLTLLAGGGVILTNLPTLSKYRGFMLLLPERLQFYQPTS